MFEGTVGVLALQGDFVEHLDVLRQLGVKTIEVRTPSQLEALRGLIIPGGESTVIGNLLHQWGLWQPIREQALQKKLSIWGTCAGAILLAKQVPNLSLEGLRIMDITIERNAFGRQVDSFSLALKTALFPSQPFPGVFIRAPVMTRVGEAVQILACLEDGTVVAAQQNHLLATSFHPELTRDTRFHAYFLDKVIG